MNYDFMIGQPTAATWLCQGASNVWRDGIMILVDG
jgi:hypothetical protein